MKKKLLSLLLVLSLSLLVGCNSYKAIAFVRSKGPKSAWMSFYSFEGKMEYKFKASEGEVLNYSAELEEGSATVYYEYNGEKVELFSISSNESVSSTKKDLPQGKFVIIVLSDGKLTNGSFSFKVE